MTNKYFTFKERGSRPIQPPPKPQAKTCPPVSRVFNRKLELTSTQKVTFLNKNETRRFESVQGTPLPSSKVYDSAKKVSYFEQAFKIEAKIGSGCFGNVYRVKSKEDGKQYAVSLKMLNGENIFPLLNFAESTYSFSYDYIDIL